MSLCLGYEVFCILIRRANLHNYIIRHSDKKLPFFWDIELFLCGISLAYWENDPFLSLTSWKGGIYSGLVNWGILLPDWISWEVHLFWMYFLHQNTWFPQPMSTTRRAGKNKQLFSKHLPVAVSVQIILMRVDENLELTKFFIILHVI